jgi:anti-anti-sigma regulatory factor
MLRITNSTSGSGFRWTLSGQLAGPWVSELRTAWESKLAESEGRPSVVDLREVTCIDEDGAGLLREMSDRGTEFVAADINTRHILEGMKTQEKPPLRKLLAYLTRPCGH